VDFVVLTPAEKVLGAFSSGFEDLVYDFDEGKIVTRCTAHVMREIPAAGATKMSHRNEAHF